MKIRLLIKRHILYLVTMLCLLPSNLPAEENQVVCAAVAPCDKEGNVVDPYNQGDCAQSYYITCQNILMNQMAGELDSYLLKIQKLEKQNQQLRKKLSAITKRRISTNK